MSEERPSTMGEFDLIGRIRRAQTPDPRVPIAIGDDCAMLQWVDGPGLLVTTDMLIEGRHFLLGEATPEQVGYKALAVNLSDIAAMAGIPRAAVVAVALPRENGAEIALGLLAGMKPLADRFGVRIVGGDTNAWEGPLVISITLMGEATGRGPVRRSGAAVGDVIFVTGPLGGSLLGRHLRPEPRVELALQLHENYPISAMIDLSDGLSSDLRHILEESGGLGASLQATAIPIHPDAVTRSERDGITPLNHALDDGEDFELLFTLSPEQARLLETGSLSGSVHRIGTITETQGTHLLDEQGNSQLLRSGGFDHLRTPPLARNPDAGKSLRIESTPGGCVIEVHSEGETARIGAALAEMVKPGTVIGLVGTLGAGKTRLVRALAEALGADPEAIASPTYVLIHEYEARLPIYHFDTYRLSSPEAFEALGVAEYFSAGGICLVEWADRVTDLLPSDAWWIRIELLPEPDGRRLTFTIPEKERIQLELLLKGDDAPATNVEP